MHIESLYRTIILKSPVLFFYIQPHDFMFLSIFRFEIYVFIENEQSNLKKEKTEQQFIFVYWIIVNLAESTFFLSIHA